MSLPHSAWLSVIAEANASADPPVLRQPAASRYSLSSKDRNASLMSVLSRATTSSGVAAGATRPIQTSPCMPENPCSSRVGVSGSSRSLCLPVTASAFSLPLLTCSAMTGGASSRTGTSPLSTLRKASVALLNGTADISISAARKTSNPTICGGEPNCGMRSEAHRDALSHVQLDRETSSQQRMRLRLSRSDLRPSQRPVENRATDCMEA
jgi:hypothetical protein